MNKVYCYHCTFKFQVFLRSVIDFVAYLPTDFTVCFLVCLILEVNLLVSNAQLLILLAGCLEGLPSRTVFCDRFRSVTRGEGGTPYNILYGGAPPESGTFFRPQV